MTINEASRQIIERVNAERTPHVEFRNMGTIAKWTDVDHDDVTAILDTLVLTLQLGVGAKRERIHDSGEATEADVQRVSQRISDYFRQPVHAAH